jgi:hypothetical protein
LGSANPAECTITNAKLNILPSKHNAVYC